MSYDKEDDVLKQLSDIAENFQAKLDEQDHVDEIRWQADKIACLILQSGSTVYDIESEKTRLKDLIRMHFPDKMHLYEMLYESRFQRLWEQFRNCEDE